MILVFKLKHLVFYNKTFNNKYLKLLKSKLQSLQYLKK